MHFLVIYNTANFSLVSRNLKPSNIKNKKNLWPVPCKPIHQFFSCPMHGHLFGKVKNKRNLLDKMFSFTLLRAVFSSQKYQMFLSRGIKIESQSEFNRQILLLSLSVPHIMLKTLILLFENSLSRENCKWKEKCSQFASYCSVLCELRGNVF